MSRVPDSGATVDRSAPPGPAGAAATDDTVIVTDGLTRYFGRRAAVCDVSLRVPRGGVVALLGRNGSGKTTLIRMLLGLSEPTRGRATVLGHDSRALPPAVRGRIGYMSESHAVYRWMRVRECGAFQAGFYPRWNEQVFRAVTDHFRLDPDARAGQLSRGERAGLSLAMTLAIEPELLVLDDPALGLDPVARRSLLEAMVFVTRRSDRTILFSSHLLDDVERVADWIAVMDRGVLRASAPVETFRERIKQYVLRFAGQAPAELPSIPGLLHARRALGELRLTIANVTPETERVLGTLGAAAVEPTAIGLEDALIGYLGDRGAKGFFLEEINGGFGGLGPPDGDATTGTRGAA